MNHFKKGQIIFVTPNLLRMPIHYQILSTTEKAIRVKSDANGKEFWFPKSVLNWNDDNKCYSVARWFIKKIPNYQLSWLQG